MTTDRLDRIEAILGQVAQQQQQFSEQLTQQHQQFSEQLTQQQQQFDARLDRLFQRIEESREEIDLLSERIGQIAQSVSELRQVQADDHALIVANQTEIRRIWEYLLSQHPNGQG